MSYSAQGHLPVRRKAKGGKDGANGTNGTNGKDAEFYQLLPSATSVRTSGSTYSVEKIRCKLRYTKGNTVSVVTSLPSGYSIKSQIDGGTETAYTINTDLSIISAKTSVTFNLYGSSSTTVPIDTVTIPVVAQGLTGCSPRRNRWTEGMEFRNDQDSTSTDIHYLDFAFIHDSTQQSGWKVYQCLKTHVSTADNKPNSGTNWKTYWKEISNYAALFAGYILADSATIDLFSGNQIRILKADGTTVTAGMSASEVGDKIRIWAGGDNPSNAPFRVNEEGKVVATNAEIQGDIVSTSTTDSGTTEVRMSSSSGSEGLTISHKGKNDSTFAVKTTFTGDDKDKSELFGNANVKTYTSGSGSVTNSATVSQSSGDATGSKNGTIATYTFKLDARSRVTIEPTSYTNVLEMYLRASNLGSGTCVLHNATEITISNSKGLVVYSQDFALDFDVAENANATMPMTVNWPGCSVMLPADNYTFTITSEITADSEQSSSSFEGLVSTTLYQYTITMDPSAYRSEFFGNGFAFGTSEDQHFQSVSYTDSNGAPVQATRSVSGNAGFSVEGGVLKLRMGGQWYSCSYNSGAIKLTATTL